MNSSSWKLARTSLRCIEAKPSVLRSIQILRHWVILIMVIALSIALLPLVQILKAQRANLQESYIVLPVFTRESELGNFPAPIRTDNANTTRRLLMFPSEMPQPIMPIVPWSPNKNAWKVKRLASEDALLFVSINVANVSYYLDLDFKGQLIWINCKWKPLDQKSGWTTWIKKFKTDQLRDPHGLVYQVPLINIKYGDEMVLHHEIEDKFFYLSLDGSSRFMYLTNEIFTPFVNIVKKWAENHGYDLQIIEGEEGTCWSFWKATVREAELIHAFNNITFVFQSDGEYTFPMRISIMPQNFIISPRFWHRQKDWYALQFEVQMTSNNLKPTFLEVWQ